MTATTTEKQSPTLTIQCQFCQTWNRIDATRAADRPEPGSGEEVELQLAAADEGS